MGEVPTRAHQELDPEEHIVVVCHHGLRSLECHQLGCGSRGSKKCSRCAAGLMGGRELWIRKSRCIETAVLKSVASNQFSVLSGM